MNPHFANGIPFTCTEAVPAFGVLVDNGVTDSLGTFITTGRKTQTLGERPIYVNGAVDMPANGSGTCFLPERSPCYVAYDSGDGTPAVGEVWGPVPGQFTVRKGLPGFKIIKAGSGGIAWAIHQPGDYWFELTANLSAGGNAASRKLKWNHGSSIYEADTSESYTLYDKTGQHWGIAGEWIRGAYAVGALQVRSHGAPWYEMTLSGDLTQGGTQTATITIRGSSRSVTVTDRFLATGDSIASGGRIGVVYDVFNNRWVAVERVC